LACAALCRLKPGVVLDWGTYHGASARMFWECAKAFRLDCEIHSIDLPPDVPHVEHPGNERGRLVRGLPGVQLHLGDGISVALDVWTRMGRPARPLFVVDGDHAYESVLGELQRIFESAADASALVHDTFWQSAQSRYNVGPAEAVEEIVRQTPERFAVIQSGLGLPGMTLLASTAALSSAATV
jgi:cephalosporin hydroxylase